MVARTHLNVTLYEHYVSCLIVLVAQYYVDVSMQMNVVFINKLSVRRVTVGVYTGCNRRNGPHFGRMFLRSNYTDITQNTYIQSSMVTEILAREV